MIFSYLNETGVEYQQAKPFDGITFYFEGNGLVQRVEELEKNNPSDSFLINQLPDYGVQLYLSEGTDNTLLDDLTIQQLYSEYDELCASYPQWIKRLEDLGTDSSGEYEIRQYLIGFTNPWVVNGEGGMVDKSDNPTNLWGDVYNDYKHILINAGTHGDEKGPCWATMLAIKDLVKSDEGWAMYIKSSFQIKLCPTLNPYGFHHRTLANYNGVNLNRDVNEATQVETQVWKSWVNANKDAVGYIDVHGVDFYHPFFEIAQNSNESDKKLYATMAAKLAAAFYNNWNDYLGTSKYPRPYTVISTYSGTTTSYITGLGIKGFTLETPCDIVSCR